jgi:hypothetical protein
MAREIRGAPRQDIIKHQIAASIAVLISVLPLHRTIYLRNHMRIRLRLPVA